MKKRIVLFFVLILLLWLISCPIIDVARTKNCPLPETKQAISENETDMFLEHFREYVARGLNKEVPEEFYTDEHRPHERLPFFVRAWFNKKCIAPERFYYVEQRLRAIVKIMDAKENFERLQKHFKEQDAFEGRREEAHDSAFENLQKEALNTEFISNEEFELVKKREAKIRALLGQ
ncbi:MAG: hypothetical protein J5895_05435 [Alphaproteobacteria bacterium]|nr:hypothetical protein [Alphaproteobacteria bacterium]